MSVFRVRLTNSRQGRLDVYDNQRSAYITGPNRINRKLKDGEIFTDCNYWKRFEHGYHRHSGGGDANFRGRRPNHRADRG